VVVVLMPLSSAIDGDEFDSGGNSDGNSDGGGDGGGHAHYNNVPIVFNNAFLVVKFNCAYCCCEDTDSK